MSLHGEHLIDLCETKGAEDGGAAGPYSPPVVEEYDQKAHDAYVANYWDAFLKRPMTENIEPNRTAVRRARMIALNRRRWGRRNDPNGPQFVN